MIRADSRTGRIIGALAREVSRPREPLFKIRGAPDWLANILVAMGAQDRREKHDPDKGNER